MSANSNTITRTNSFTDITNLSSSKKKNKESQHIDPFLKPFLTDPVVASDDASIIVPVVSVPVVKKENYWEVKRNTSSLTSDFDKLMKQIHPNENSSQTFEQSNKVVESPSIKKSKNSFTTVQSQRKPRQKQSDQNEQKST